MNNFLRLLTLSLLLLCLSCEKEPFVDFQLPDNRDYLEFTAEGGYADIEIVANCNYEIFCNDSWISASKNEDGVNIIIESNLETTSRESEIHISYSYHNEKVVQSIKIKQEAFEPVLLVERTELNFDSEGGSIDITIEANAEFNISEDADWITYTVTDNIIRITADASHVVDERSTEVIITMPKYDINQNVRVVQKAFIPSLKVDETELIFSAIGGTQNINVITNAAFSISVTENWITCTQYDNSIKINVSASSITEERSANITISLLDYDNNIQIVKVTQKVFEPQLIVEDVDTLEFDYRGGNKTIEVISNFDYEISNTADWLEVEKVANGVKAICHPNNETLPRSTSIVISGKAYGLSNTAILISQLPIPSEGNIIEYTTTFNGDIEPYNTNAFNANIVSNTYVNGKGVIVFDAPITKIGAQAFYHIPLTSITIPNSVTRIEESAFNGCSNLKNVYGMNKVKTIGYNAFYNCTNLINITIPDSVVSIEEAAFSNCYKLKSVNISGNVTSIGNNALYGCHGLTNVVIGDNVTTIGENAFYECSGLSSLKMGSNVKSIGKSAFAKCDSLSAIYITDLYNWCSINFGNGYANPLHNKAKLYVNQIIIEDITMPSGIKIINDYAFYGCGNQMNVTIGNDVESIGDAAFYNCSLLTKIVITDNVLSIGDSAFLGCSSLNSVTIGNKVTTIGGYAFNNCTSLKNLEIGYRVKNIGWFAFEGCSSLTSIVIPDMVETLEQDTFHSCTALRTAIIGEGVKNIRGGVFGNCYLLNSVTIGSNVVEIGQAFYGCESLKYIYCKPTIPPAIYYNDLYAYDPKGSFPYNSGMKIYVPKSSYDLYTQYDSYDYQSSKNAQGNWAQYKYYISAYNF